MLNYILATHMQHERDGLHLDGGGLKVPGGSDVPLQVGREAVVLVELSERTHGIRNVSSIHVDLVGIAKCIGLRGRSGRLEVSS